MRAIERRLTESLEVCLPGDFIDRLPQPAATADGLVIYPDGRASFGATETASYYVDLEKGLGTLTVARTHSLVTDVHSNIIADAGGPVEAIKVIKQAGVLGKANQVGHVVVAWILEPGVIGNAPLMQSIRERSDYGPYHHDVSVVGWREPSQQAQDLLRLDVSGLDLSSKKTSAPNTVIFPSRWMLRKQLAAATYDRVAERFSGS